MNTLLPALEAKFAAVTYNGKPRWSAVKIASDRGLVDNYKARWNTGLFFWSQSTERKDSKISNLLKEVLTVSALIIINVPKKGNQEEVLTDANYGMGALSQVLWDGLRTDKTVGGVVDGLDIPYRTKDFEIPATMGGLQQTALARRHIFTFYRETESWGDPVCPETI